MALSYANILDRIEQFLQDLKTVASDATELGYLVEDELKRLSQKDPHIIDVIYQIESRTGGDTAGTTDKLTDTSNNQFLATDATLEKVIHNIRDDTWTVVSGYTSASVLSIGADIMASGEDYEMYNKRCRNKRQIYIGDMPPYLHIESVEYPVGTERNFIQISKDIIELDVADFVIEDSDTTLSPLNNVDVLVKFALPHVLTQLTDLAGACTAIEPADETTLAVKELGTTEVIEIGDELHIAGHMSLYIVTTGVTLSSGAGDIVVHPGMEAATAVDDVVTFTKSTLQPIHEDLLERMVSSRAVQSDMIKYSRSGAPIMRNYQAWINNNPLLDPVRIDRELEALSNPRMAKVLPRGTVLI